MSQNPPPRTTSPTENPKITDSEFLSKAYQSNLNRAHPLPKWILNFPLLFPPKKAGAKQVKKSFCSPPTTTMTTPPRTFSFFRFNFVAGDFFGGKRARPPTMVTLPTFLHTVVGDVLMGAKMK